MGRWITVHAHHVYLKDPNEIDDSLKGKQFKKSKYDTNSIKGNNKLKEEQ